MSIASKEWIEYIFNWILSKKNSLTYSTERFIFFDEMNLFSNDLVVGTLDVNKFYIIEHKDKKDFTYIEGKNEFKLNFRT
jgi:hypothetical protein